MTVSVCIPIYFNDLSLYQVIDRCIQSVLTHYPQAELILVDDASPLDTSDWPITHRNKSNMGFTATVNKALELARGEVLVIMNDDIELAEGDLDRFFIMYQVIASPKTTDEGPGDFFGSIWGMNRATLARVGQLDYRLRNYFSDLEYYWRARSLDVPIIKWTDVVVKHLGGATFAHEPKNELYQKDKRMYEHIRGLDRRTTGGVALAA